MRRRNNKLRVLCTVNALPYTNINHACSIHSAHRLLSATLWLYHRKEAAYWENLVARTSKNPKRLWSSIIEFMECVANPFDLWKRRPSPLHIFLTCSLPKPIASVLPQWTLRRRNFLQQHQLLSTFVRFSSPTCV